MQSATGAINQKPMRRSIKTLFALWALATAYPGLASFISGF